MSMDKDYLNKLTNEINARKLDAMLIAPSEDLLYLLGHSPLLCERFQGLFITKDGSYFYICNLLTADEMKKCLPEARVYAWFDGDGFLDAVRAAFEENKLTGGKIGINNTVRAYNILEIAAEIPVTWVSARDLCHEARILKTPQELEDMRIAAGIADHALADVLPLVQAGVSEQQLKDALLARMVELGGTAPRALVAAGPNGGYPHYNLGQRVLQRGDAVIMDFTCEYHRMRTDMTRTVFVGEASERQRRIYQLVLQANLTAEEKAVNGAFIPDVDAAARDLIAAAGFGPYFTTRLGHGIGYLGHEAPDIKKNNPRRLLPGMAFTIEPGIYLADDFGVRIEDCVIINTRGETEILHSYPKELTIVGH